MRGLTDSLWTCGLHVVIPFCVAEPPTSPLFDPIVASTGATYCTIGDRVHAEGEGCCGSIKSGAGANKFCLSGVEGDDGIG